MPTKKIFVGNQPIAQVRKGSSMQFPSPVKDGLVLWYDFMGRTNSDAKRDVAEDLSGNGNNGTLTNFAYTAGSGYEDERELEGRNLYAHSKGVYFYPNYSTLIEVNSSYIKFSLNRDHTTNVALRLNSFYNIQKPNTTYAISGTMYINEKPIKKEDINRFNTSPNVIEKSITINDDGSFVFIYDTTENIYSYQLHMQIHNAITGDEIKISKLKIEEGPTETPWRPAMEDPEYEEWVREQGVRRGLAFDGVDDATGISKVQFGPSQDWTAIFTLDFSNNAIGSWMDFLGTGSTSTIMFHPTAGFGWYMRYVNQVTYMPASGWMVGDMLPINTKIVLVIKCEYINGQAKMTFYRNDVPKITSHNLPPEWDGFAFSFLGNSHRTFKGHIYSTRVYNRALTQEEIAHNYQIEKERWGLE